MWEPGTVISRAKVALFGAPRSGNAKWGWCESKCDTFKKPKVED